MRTAGAETNAGRNDKAGTGAKEVERAGGDKEPPSGRSLICCWWLSAGKGKEDATCLGSQSSWFALTHRFKRDKKHPPTITFRHSRSAALLDRTAPIF